MTYPKMTNTTVYVGYHAYPYKSYYNMVAAYNVAGLILHYKISKAAAMQLLK